MKKYIILLISIVFVGFSSAEETNDDTFFTDYGNAVGYIKTDSGKKYIVIETQSGAKLIEVKDNPEKILDKNKGISGEDFKIK